MVEPPSNESAVPTRVIRPDRRRALRVCVTVVVICILLTATGCFVMMFRPGRDILNWRMIRSVMLLAALVSGAFVPAFIAFYFFEKAKHWVVDADGIEIHDPNYGVEHAAWREIEEVQVREHGVTLVMRSEAGYAPLNRVSTFPNRSMCFVDPGEAAALVQLHLSLGDR